MLLQYSRKISPEQDKHYSTTDNASACGAAHSTISVLVASAVRPCVNVSLALVRLGTDQRAVQGLGASQRTGYESTAQVTPRMRPALSEGVKETGDFF